MDPIDSEDIEEDKFKFEVIARESKSSPGRHDSTIIAFSKQLTKSSAMSLDPND